MQHCTIPKLTNNIVLEVKIPEDWNLPHTINSFRGKRVLLNIGDYCGPKLWDYIMKIVEHVMERIIDSILKTDETVWFHAWL